MVRPNFFIVGAPKCGTSAMYEYLRAHPDVFMPTRKEPKFFSTDLDSGSARDGEVVVRGLDNYLALFAPGESRRRVGEATALYLFSREAATNIHAFDQEARIIVMLRNPVDLMYAFHGERLYNGNEDIPDFREALAAEGDRMKGKRLPPGGSIPAALQYRSVASLPEQLQRYLDLFGREGIKIILFDDFRKDPGAAYQDVLSFLNLPGHSLPDYAVVNASKRRKSAKFAALVRRPPAFITSLARAIAPQRLRTVMAKGLIEWNTERGERPSLDPDLRDSLTREFEPQVRQLQELIGRDLSHWLESSTGTALQSREKSD